LSGLFDAVVQYRNKVIGHGGLRPGSFYKELGLLLFPALNEVLAEGCLDLLGPSGSRLIYLDAPVARNGGGLEVPLRHLVGERGRPTAPLILEQSQLKHLVPERVALLWPDQPVPLSLDPLLLYLNRDQGEEVLILNGRRDGGKLEYLNLG